MNSNRSAVSSTGYYLRSRTRSPSLVVFILAVPVSATLDQEPGDVSLERRLVN